MVAAGKVASDTNSIVLCLAGVDRSEDKARVLSAIAELLPHAHAHVDNDAVAALASGTKGILEGIVVISGTGFISINCSD